MKETKKMDVKKVWLYLSVFYAVLIFLFDICDLFNICSSGVIDCKEYRKVLLFSINIFCAYLYLYHHILSEEKYRNRIFIIPIILFAVSLQFTINSKGTITNELGFLFMIFMILSFVWVFIEFIFSKVLKKLDKNFN